MATLGTNGRTARSRILRELGRIPRSVRTWLHPPRPPSLEPQLVLGRDDIEVHTLACTRDVPMSLWSLKSFIAASGLLPRIVVHDDGSLTSEDRRLYAQHFDGITVLDEADSRTRMEEHLAAWPACLRARRHPGFYCARKLLDVLFLCDADHVLYVDSDILFFQPPEELLKHARTGTPCFSSDYQDAYGAPRAELERWAGAPVEGQVNAGLLHIPVAAYRERLGLIERYLAWAEAELQDAILNRHEQTAHALVMSDLGAARLPPAYALTGGLRDDTVSYHFVGDGHERRQLWTRAVPGIRRGLEKRLRAVATR